MGRYRTSQSQSWPGLSDWKMTWPISSGNKPHHTTPCQFVCHRPRLLVPFAGARQAHHCASGTLATTCKIQNLDGATRKPRHTSVFRKPPARKRFPQYLGLTKRWFFQKGGFGGCSPGTKTGTRVHLDVPPERKSRACKP